MNIREVVIIYQNKNFVSRDLLLKLLQHHTIGAITPLLIGIEVLYEITNLKLLEGYSRYNLDEALKRFDDTNKETQKFFVSMTDCVYLDKHTLLEFSKLPMERKYHRKHILPLIKIFGKYYIVCNKIKDINSNVAIMTEK